MRLMLYPCRESDRDFFFFFFYFSLHLVHFGWRLALGAAQHNVEKLHENVRMRSIVDNQRGKKKKKKKKLRRPGTIEPLEHWDTGVMDLKLVVAFIFATEKSGAHFLTADGPVFQTVY